MTHPANPNPVSRRSFLGGAAAIGVAAAAGANQRSLSLASAHRDELVTLLADLVRVQSLSGESARAAQDVVKGFLSDLPFRIDESADRPSRYAQHPEFMPPNPAGDGPFINVVGWPTDGSARHAAMFSHIDTHSLDEGWQTPPLEPVIQGNRMMGLGTSDDKGGVAAMLVAARILAEEGGPLPVVMSLHGKGGGSRGSLPVFERISGMDHRIGSVLYVHPAETGRGLEDIKNEVMGVVDLQLKVTGWRAPPMEIGSVDSSPWQAGGNAVETCFAILDRLRQTAFADVQFNLGIMDGGDRAGSVAADAAATFRLKFAGDNTWRALLDSARREIETLADEFDGYTISIEPAGYRTNPGAADWDAPVSRVLRDSIESVTGRAPDAYPNHYAGDIRYPIRLLGVPAYGIGSIGGNFYGPNEWVDIDDLVNLVAVLVQTLSGWDSL